MQIHKLDCKCGQCHKTLIQQGKRWFWVQIVGKSAIQSVLGFMLFFVMILVNAVAYDPNGDAAAALALAVASQRTTIYTDGCQCRIGSTCICDDCPGGDCCECRGCPCKAARDAYSRAYAQSIRTGQPLLVFVGQPARRIEGCVCVRWDRFPGATGPAVILGVVAGSEVTQRATLAGAPDDATIRRAVTPAPVVVPVSYYQTAGAACST